MRCSRSILLVSLSAILLSTPSLRGEEPTPTPRPKPAKRLGGGSFGIAPSRTPAAKADGGASLARVVRKTQDEVAPAGAKRPRSIVITNETLRRSEPTQASTSISNRGTSAGKPTIKLPPTPTPGSDAIPEYKDAVGRTEAQWRERAVEARTRVEKASSELEGAQAEVHRLENDFYAWSDGNYRERVIRPAWDQAKERLKALEAEADAARDAVSALEEEARKSGTPPGWLR